MVRAAFAGAVLMLTAAGTACGGAATPPSGPPSGAAAPADAAGTATGGPLPDAEHEHAAPHGGVLLELGEEFAHLELVVDASTASVTAYALDGEAERPVRLTQPAIEIGWTPVSGQAERTVTLTAVANTLTGEAAGDTSEFRATDVELVKANAFSGVVRVVTVKGREFRNVPFDYPGTGH